MWCGLIDDELGKRPDPAAVLRCWLDSPAALPRSEVYRAVVKSRYRTLEHLRQIPAGEVLARPEPEAALKILLDTTAGPVQHGGRPSPQP